MNATADFMSYCMHRLLSDAIVGVVDREHAGWGSSLSIDMPLM